MQWKLLSVLVLVVFSVGCVNQLNTEEDFKIVWGNYLKNYLSKEYIQEHFEIKDVHIASKPNTGSILYVIRYGEIIAHTRAATEYKGEMISGLTRITDGEIEEYHGPLKEYELKILEETARSIMQKNGCTYLESLTLTIGDYTYKGGKYPSDYGMEGFYWSGGKPEDGRIGDECTVNAENGTFKIKVGAPI